MKRAGEYGLISQSLTLMDNLKVHPSIVLWPPSVDQIPSTRHWRGSVGSTMESALIFPTTNRAFGNSCEPIPNTWSCLTVSAWDKPPLIPAVTWVRILSFCSKAVIHTICENGLDRSLMGPNQYQTFPLASCQNSAPPRQLYSTEAQK